MYKYSPAFYLYTVHGKQTVLNITFTYRTPLKDVYKMIMINQDVLNKPPTTIQYWKITDDSLLSLQKDCLHQSYILR